MKLKSKGLMANSRHMFSIYSQINTIFEIRIPLEFSRMSTVTFARQNSTDHAQSLLAIPHFNHIFITISDTNGYGY